MKINSFTLKDAGWVCVEVGDSGPLTPKEHRNRYEKWAMVSEISRGYTRRHLIYDRTTDEWKLDGKVVTDIDEL